jgi:uncharacterized membrane protein
MEIFSDGVIAILITIMVLELRPPQGASLAALRAEIPSLLTYAMSFLFLGTYWNSHHHMLHLTERVNGAVLWANLHLLFWLSLIPFATSWMTSSDFAAAPTAFYGFVMSLSAIAFTVLEMTVIAAHGTDSALARAVGSDRKGKFSIVLLVSAIPLAFLNRFVSDALYVLVCLMWIIPDARVERFVATSAPTEEAEVPRLEEEAQAPSL